MSYISVSDLLDYITPEADLKAREAQKKARAKVINNFFNPGYSSIARIFFTTNISSHLSLKETYNSCYS